jgi:SAM-dependent methyltransferase
MDEEFLPFAPESFDLIVSNLGLHWVNDVPGALTQIRAALKPGGMFIASLVGEQSLHELRGCLVDAELAVMGGISPRLSPTIDLHGASALMQRAGFALPVADKESITLRYMNMFALMRDLRGMGQTNTHAGRVRQATRRGIFFEAARLYQDRFGDMQGHIPATFDIIYLHGWR